MIPNDRAFNGNISYEFEGRTYFRWHYIHEQGDYTLRFKIVETNSNHKQGIALFFSNFRGKIEYNNESLPVLKKIFQHYLFKEDEITDHSFELRVHADEGSLILTNASQLADVDVYVCGAFSSAFWIEPLAPNLYRFHCNDHKEDDDFNDLIFDMFIFHTK